MKKKNNKKGYKNIILIWIVLSILFMLSFIPSICSIKKIKKETNETNKTDKNTTVELTFKEILNKIPTWEINLIAIGSGIITIVGFFMTVKQSIDAKNNAELSEELATKTEEFSKKTEELTKKNSELAIELSQKTVDFYKELDNKTNQAVIDTINRIQTDNKLLKEHDNKLIIKTELKKIKKNVFDLVKTKKNVQDKSSLLAVIRDSCDAIAEVNIDDNDITSFVEDVQNKTGNDYTFEEMKEMKKTVITLWKKIDL